MTDSNHPTIGSVFNLLNQWRHLPFYSLETRAAPFFAVFLRDVLSAHFKEEIHETLIPEFPLRIGTLYADRESGEVRPQNGPKPSPDQSYNVDYVALGTKSKTAYLVELKADLDSIRPEQNEYLLDAKKLSNEKGLHHFIKGVRKLAKKSKKKQKYTHLLHTLSDLGLVWMPDDLYEKSFRREKRASPGWSKAIKELEIKGQEYSKTEVVFVQPTKDKSDDCDFKHIYFDEVADVVQTRGDLGCTFANYLRQWTKPAGSPDPRLIDLNAG